MTILLIIMFMIVINTYQAHDENIEKAKLKATGCSWERGTPVLALQDVRVEPKEVEPDTDQWSYRWFFYFCKVTENNHHTNHSEPTIKSERALAIFAMLQLKVAGCVQSHVPLFLYKKKIL